MVVCWVGLGMLFMMAIVGQFRALILVIPHASVDIDATGIAFQYGNSTGWRAVYASYFPPEWSAKHLLAMPGLLKRPGGSWLCIPWWLLLTGTLLTALVWRLTRRRKFGPAFPVESPNISTESK